MRLISQRSLPKPMIIWSRWVRRQPPPLVHRRAHLGDRRVKTNEDRLADQKVTDIELDDFGQARDDPGGGEIEAVAGVTFESLAARKRRRLLDPCKFVFGPLGLSMRERVAPGARMKFDHRRSDRARRPPLLTRWLDEQGDAYPGFKQFGCDDFQVIVAAYDIEAALGGALAAFFRDKTTGMRPRIEGDRHHVVGCRHLEVQRFRNLPL